MTSFRHTARAAALPAAGTVAAAVVVFALAAGGAPPAAAASVPLSVALAPAAEGEKVKYYVVTTQANGEPEFLFSIAEKVLGDGNRYNEIFLLNKGHAQPGGAIMRNATSIAPGWILQLPPDAKGPGVQEGPLPKPGVVTVAPATPPPVQAPATQVPAATGATATPTGQDSSALTLAIGAGGALVAGAGVGTLVMRRRAGSRRAPVPAGVAPLTSATATPVPAESTLEGRTWPTTTAVPPVTPVRAPRSVAPRTASPTPRPKVDRTPETEVAGTASGAAPATAPAAPLRRSAVTVAGSPARPAPGAATRLSRSRPADDREADRHRPPARSVASPHTFQVSFGDDLVDISLSTGHPTQQETAIAWMPVPYDVPDGGAAFVCLGAAEGSGCLFLDLAQAPGPVVVRGDRAAARRLMESIVLQLSASSVLEHSCATALGPLRGLAEGLTGIETLGTMAELVERRAEEVDPPFEFVFCAPETDADRTAVDDLLNGPGQTVLVVLGGLEGAAWTLNVSAGDTDA
ncbi:hypothetical protein [Streptomyces wedmorensis]|uniref:hypothetical protein n=1 Tax=Streptomyces wedmorensis TaxID=43759 RepID=UPI00379B4641